MTGVGGPAGRAVALALHRRGHVVLGVDTEPVRLPGIRTTLVPAATHPGFPRALHGIAAGVGADLVIPTVCEELVVLAGHRSAVPVVVAPEPGVRLAADKWLTARALHRAGVAVPRTVLAGTYGQFLGLPVLSKPRRGRAGQGVVVHRDGRGLAELDGATVLQEFAPGVEYCPAVYRGRGLDVVVVLEKIALAQGRVGNAVAVRRVDTPDVAALARAAVTALGLTGPVDVDIRRRANGMPVVLEVNARFGAHAASVPELFDAVLAEYLGPVHSPHGVAAGLTG